jgi:ATP/maltotriose-dependent transcriptional regulator MalT
MTTTVSEARIFKHRIIERPRLFTLLDESDARIRTLVASAGYGKTTLAEQWIERNGRRGAWYTARSASTDVASLALGIARSSASIVQGCDARLREHLRVLADPAEDVTVLAEILAEDLERWPESAWLVIDDYHELAEEPRAERFIETLASASSIELLIASRQRPSWVSTKMILYGDVLELNQTALAMDGTEAAEVMAGRSAPSASGIVSLANGWPAVIGLASVSSAEPRADFDQMPESLYRYFAEEVFAALGRDVQAGLTTLAVAPVLDRQLAVTLLGREAAERACSAALDVGVVVERGPELELHPLARSFLADWGGQLGLEPAPGSTEACLEHYRARRDWDAAFELLASRGPAGELEALLGSALDELLETARLSTVQRWCELAATSGVDAPIFAVASAEVALRHGRHVEAMAHAEVAAARDPGLAFRALSLAGRAAHLSSREERALDLYRQAEYVAADDAERRDAMWGQLACLIDLEHADAEALLELLSESVSLARPRDYVRAAVLRVYLQLRLGSLDLDEADTAQQLLAAVNDPHVVLSFLSGYGTALALSARYSEADAVAGELLRTADHHRYTFAVPHGLSVSAMASSGLREWQTAEERAREALTRATAMRDVHVVLLSTSILLRLYAQQGRYREALRLPFSCRGALPASIGELNGSRALVLACAGRFREALELVRSSPATRAVEPVVLASAVEAIVATKSGSADAVERVRHLERIAFEVGAVDLLVVSYRACPELLTVLLHANGGGHVESLLRQVGDVDLALAAGRPIADAADRTALLSPREREVYELLETGLTNRQIAKLLFIEPSTVKVHAQHIYEKTGVHSRKALAVLAALERSRQATSAIDPTDPSDSGDSATRS